MLIHELIFIYIHYTHTFKLEKYIGSDGKESTYNTGDLGLTPGLGRSSGERNTYPLQYSCLENSMDREAWSVSLWGCNIKFSFKKLKYPHKYIHIYYNVNI